MPTAGRRGDDAEEEQRTHADDDLFAFCEGGGRGEFGEKGEADGPPAKKAKTEGTGQVKAMVGPKGKAKATSKGKVRATGKATDGLVD